jgi:hypothetical protein
VADITFTRSGNLTLDSTISGTVQGNMSVTDFVTSGFATFTATTFSLVIPANSASKTCTITPVADSLLEATESLFLTVTEATNGGYVRNASTIVTFTDDDSTTLVRIVGGGKKLLGAPSITNGAADGYSEKDLKKVTYVAPNTQAFATAISREWLDGRRALLEFDVSILSAGTPGFRLEYYFNTTPYFRVGWAADKFTTQIPGAAFVWDTIFVADRERVATWQFLLDAGTFKAYLNGVLEFTDTYTLQATSGVYMAMETRSGTFSTSGLKIRTGSFNWTPGVFNA